MKKYLVTILKVLIFLMILFESMRIMFAFFYWELINADQVPYVDVLLSLVKSIKLDLSTACYITALPAIAMFVGTCINKKTNYKWMRWYFYLVIAVYILIVVGEMNIYNEWRTKLSYKALVYLKNPSEVFNTASSTQLVRSLSLWAAFTVLFCWWYVKWVEPTDKLDDIRTDYVISYPVGFVVVIFFLVIGMRGGFGDIPISTSAGYFSNYKLPNVIAVNPAYNLLENTINTRKVDEMAHFSYMDFEKAEKITQATHETDCDSTFPILKTKNPNIMVILLESWSADLIESLGGDPSITPNFHELEKEGLLFTNIYASANRSQQAIASLYSGLPGLPVTTITDHPEKYYAMPSIVKSLDTLGYYSSFYFGGELNYGNILSYLRYNELDNIIEGKDVDAKFHKGKLGIHDTDMLLWVADEIKNQPEPFFTTAFTLSSHSPYDYPKIFEELEWPQLEKVYVNSAKYTDIALDLFMDRAKHQPWYDNTLFVFIADHSHPSYKNHRMESFDYHKIPMLIMGEPLEDSLRGKHFDKICGNTDFPATILSQLGLSHGQFIWSKDVFNKCYRPFAFFELNEGFGWKTDDGECVVSDNYEIVNTFPPKISDSIVMQGKAYMQYHFNLYCSY